MDSKIALTKSQIKALKQINKYAQKYKQEAQEEIKEILLMSNNEKSGYFEALDKIKKHAQVAIHFHPDRPDSVFKTTIENLYEQGIYKNQFETKISSGGLSAYKGGGRYLWEKQLFGGAYNRFSTKDEERPKYGSLNLMLDPDGPSPRFGSCFLLLKPEVSHRCTFTYMDSHQLPKERGTYEEFGLIIQRLLRDTFHYNNTFGENNISVKDLLLHFFNNLDKPYEEISNREAKRKLNNYIEAQIHGKIRLEKDIETFIADPSFQKTNIGDIIEKTCQKYSINLFWHMGFAMNLDDIPTDFRGKEMPELAENMTMTKCIDTHHLGLAVMDVHKNPEKWQKWGSKSDAIQKIKLLWHVLVKYGKRYKEIYK